MSERSQTACAASKPPLQSFGFLQEHPKVYMHAVEAPIHGTERTAIAGVRSRPSSLRRPSAAPA